MIRVVLPTPLRALAGVGEEIRVPVDAPVTLRRVLDAVEQAHPMLRGTIRDQTTFRRRAFLRFFACARDLSHDAPDDPLPDAVTRGDEPLLVVGAIAGG